LVLTENKGPIVRDRLLDLARIFMELSWAEGPKWQSLEKAQNSALQVPKSVSFFGWVFSVASALKK
jgi:hypothetical protein